MATKAPRRALIVQIQRRLSSFSTSQLLTIVNAIDDGNITAIDDESSDSDLYEIIVDYVRSDKLKALEDEGMSQLLVLDDLTSDLLKPAAAMGPGGDDPATTHTSDPSSPQHNELHSLHLNDIPGEDHNTGTPLRRLPAPDQTSGRVGLPRGHRAIGCLQRNVSGNVTRSQERGSQ
uniref:Uncharacterized protein n=1 Tax=Knipowitschia caucasica TaxID=637954 RepID=A0AAV2JFF1_KNICA